MAKRKPTGSKAGGGGAHPNGEARLEPPNPNGAPSADASPGGGTGGTFSSDFEDDRPLEPPEARFTERFTPEARPDPFDDLPHARHEEPEEPDEVEDDRELLDDEPSGDMDLDEESGDFDSEHDSEHDEPTVPPRGRPWTPNPATAFGAGLGRFEPAPETPRPPPQSMRMPDLDRARRPEPSRFPEPEPSPRARRAFEPRATGYEPLEELPELPNYGGDEDSVPPAHQGGLFGGGYVGGPAPKMPAWARTSEYPSTHRLKVKRVEIDGRESDLGTVHPTITEEELIARWPRAQQLLLFPLDAMGKNLAPNNPARLDIAEDHAVLQALRRRGRAPSGDSEGGGHWAAPPVDSNKDVMTLVQSLIENQKLESERLRQEMRAREERLERRDALLNERANALRENETSLAVMNSDQLRTSQDRLIAGFETRNNGLIEILAKNAAEERERRREEERADRDRREEMHRREKEERDARHAQEMALQRQLFEQQQARDAAWLERQREADRRESERERHALEREEKRQERWAREQHAAMLERDKMRHEHMETIIAANGSGGLEKLAQNIQALKEVQEELGGGDDGESKEPWMVQAAKAGAEVVRAFKGVPPGGAAPAGYGMGGEDFDGPYGPPQLPGPPPPGTLAIPPGYTVALVADPQTGQPVPVLVPMNQAAAQQGMQGNVQQQQQQGAQQGQQQQQQHTPGQVINMPGGAAGSTNQVAQQAGMQLPDVKVARDVIRQTVRALKQAPQDAWGEIIMGALGQSPAAVNYLRAVSVFVAVKEGGADDILASDICLGVAPFAQQQGIPVRP